MTLNSINRICGYAYYGRNYSGLADSKLRWKPNEDPNEWVWQMACDGLYVEMSINGKVTRYRPKEECDEFIDDLVI